MWDSVFEQFGTIVLTLIAALSSERAWRYWQKKQTVAVEEKQEDRKDQNLWREDLRIEVERLRTELVALYDARDKERREMAENLADIREQLASFRTRVEYLEKENSELRDRLAALKAKAELKGLNLED